MAECNEKQSKSKTNYDETDCFAPSENRPFYIETPIDGHVRKVYVTKEVYDFHVNYILNEKKRLDRLSRCAVGSDSGGLKRCTLDCSQCPYSNAGMRSGLPASPEYLHDEYGLDIAGDEDVADDYSKKELTDALHAQLSLLPERDRNLMWMHGLGYPLSEIAARVGVSKVAVHKRIETLTKRLREALWKLK